MTCTHSHLFLCRFFAISSLCIAGVILAACGNGDLKEDLGLTHRAPDEFQVYSRPALSVPPEFDLRPPGQGSPYVAGTPTDEQAHNQILAVDSAGAVTPLPDAQPAQQQHFLAGAAPTAVTPVSAVPLASNSDMQFLADAGAQKSDPHIRQEIQDDKFSAPAPKKSSYLFNFGDSDAPSEVDAQKEADRIKQDKASNQPVTTGDTPVVATQDKGIWSMLGDIF